MKNNFDHTIHLFFLFFSLVLSEMLEAGIELEPTFPIQPLEKLAVDKGYELELQDPLYCHVNFTKPAYQLWDASWKGTSSNFWTFLETEKATLILEFPAVYDLS